MDVVQTSMLLLLLAALGATVEPSPENCHGLNATLRREHLHKVFGDWVLVWGVTNNNEELNFMQNVSSSHLELRLLADNKTVTYTERNMHKNASCTTYVFNMSLTDDHILRALTVSATVETGGVVSPYIENGFIVFHETCDGCLSLSYIEVTEDLFPNITYLLKYRREGHHLDVDVLKEDHNNHTRHAKCDGYSTDDEPFIYDGAADFCHKTSGAEPIVGVEPTVLVQPAAES
ncbi:saxitoxin and tetrodotoxin-binding protein 1-like [Centropristis striata]|uniref:saxitoxin and tetrodotoxin-binding protein 1-like n=1 Tax=Centropristis striata TaxID=184440 RepID=UPI0027E138D7|nr:saxitoxin and tetrodotoxin-binding protein 1-like [Centropristis striata]